MPLKESSRNKIIGHTKQRTLLNRLLQNDRLPHALLICGKAGIGKRLVALELAEKILTRSLDQLNDSQLDKTLKLIRQGEHPDLHFLIPQENKKSIGVEEIRLLQERLSLTPYYRTGACIIIEDAETMSIQAANCLLKTLEEPIENRFFILISSSPHLIPPTIVSRSQKLLLGSLNKEEVQEILTKIIGSSSMGDLNDLLLILDGSLELLNISPTNRFHSVHSYQEEGIKKAILKAKEIHEISVRFSHLYESIDNQKRFISESTHLFSTLEKENNYTNQQIVFALMSYYRNSIDRKDRSTKLRVAEDILNAAKTWDETKKRNLNLTLQLGHTILQS
jgi:DNA polymerase III delta prime subunit